MKRILVDVCCAPCSIPAIENLQRKYPGLDIAIFSNNSNIHPEDEYEKRTTSIKRIAIYYGKMLSIDKYSPEEWLIFVKGLEKEAEGGKRCNSCYEFRIGKAAEFAKKNKFDLLATTLTTGPPKQAEVINRIGKKICDKFNILFIEEDFKKGDGFLRSVKMSKELNLYRQNYCGCKFSIRN
jgi:predicted adenine nucleotide alpha hydrolase (AANH) superfamily ATPase